MPPILNVAIPSPDFGVASWLSPYGFNLLPFARIGDADLSEIDVIVSSMTTHYTEEMMTLAPRLRLIVSPIIGVDTIDIDAAGRHAILVANCPAPENVIGMAEATVMLSVASLLNLKRKEASLRSGRFMPPHDSGLMSSRTLGFVGYGRIAQQVEQRLQGWNVRTQHHDPVSPASVSLHRLLETSDIVSIHVTLNEQTRWLIGKAELAAMKPGAVLLNTSRGGVVDEHALADALNSGALRAAAVDVFAREPIEGDNPLLDCDPERVILTPHCIGHNAETGPSSRAMLSDAIMNARAGLVPSHVLNPQVVNRWIERWSGT